MATLQTLPEATTLLTSGAGPSTGSFASRIFLYAVFKHRRLVVGVFLLVFLASALAAVLRPSGWRATSKVLVKLGETVQLAPAEAPSKSITLPLTPEVVNTEGEIVRSHEVIEEAVHRLGVTPEPGTSFDEMIAGMQLALTVQPTPSSNVLQISYIGRSAERSARMVNAITDVYMDRHNVVYRDEGTHSFYTEQLRGLEAQMKDAQRKLREYLKKEHIVDVDQEIHILNQDVVEQEKMLKAHRGKMQGTARKLAEVHTQLKRTPEQIDFAQEFLTNPTLLTFKQKMAELEIERYQLLQRYLPSDRHVKDKEEEIANLQVRIREEKERILNKQTLQSNEVYRELQRNALAHEVTLVDLTAREPSLMTRLHETRRRLHDLRDKRFAINALKQDADEKGYAFDLYWKKREEARISEAMKNQSMVSVSVLERATPPVQPVSGLLLPLLLGVFGGFVLAAAMAVGVEYLNRRLRFEEEVERYLELPVLAVIPDLETAPGIVHA